MKMKKLLLSISATVVFFTGSSAQINLSATDTKVITPYKTDLSFPNKQNYTEHWAKEGDTWKIISKQYLTYTTQGLVESIEIWPIFGGGPTYRLEFSYNEQNQIQERIKYEFMGNAFKEVERKLYSYDKHYNLTELQTLYKGEQGYIFANYDQSYRFEYTYNKANQITSVLSEYFQLSYNSAWIKASKRMFSYREDGSLESITRLPYSYEKKDYVQEGSARFSNLNITQFNFKDFFFSGQILENLSNCTQFTFEEFDAESNAYKTIRTARFDGTKFQSEYASGERIERFAQIESNLLLQKAESSKDNQKTDGVLHQYITRADGSIKEDQIFHLNPDTKQYEMTEKYIYEQRKSIDLNNTSIVKLYPNPSNNVSNLSIELPESAMVNIKVFDVTGKWIQHALTLNQQQLQSGNHLFNISSLNKGQYVVEVSINNVLYHQKLVVI
jgi:hypothetical protein